MTSERRRGRVGAHRGVEGPLSVWEMEERTRSSVYATAQTVVWPWSDPGVARRPVTDGRAAVRRRTSTSAGCSAAPNTVYLCSPIEDQRRLAPAFGGLLNDLINQAYRHVAATGKPLDPPLLVVIDEAGNTPLRALPEYASTLAGHRRAAGDDLAVARPDRGRLRPAGRHDPHEPPDQGLLRRAVRPGVAALRRPGARRRRGRHPVALGRRAVGGGSDQFSTTRVPLAPAHVLRQMRPGDALLLHGTLPPAHVRTRPFYRDRQLARRAASATSVADGERGGEAVPPPDRPRPARARSGWVSEPAGHVGRQRGRGRLRPAPAPGRAGSQRPRRHDPIGARRRRATAASPSTAQQEMWVRDRVATERGAHSTGSTGAASSARRHRGAAACDRPEPRGGPRPRAPTRR